MAKLLRGYTDLLQPINLLPDILAGGGGYPLSGSVKSTSFTKISKDISIRTDNITIYYVFSNRTLRLYSEVPIGSSYIRIRLSDWIAKADEIYTSKYWFTDNGTTIFYYLGAFYGNNTAYYRSQKNGEACGIIRKVNDDGQPMMYLGTPNDKCLDITINNIAIYEGAYTNPPFCKSIAQLNNEGLMGLVDQKFLTSSAPFGYFKTRTVILDKNDGSSNKRCFWNLLDIVPLGAFADVMVCYEGKLYIIGENRGTGSDFLRAYNIKLAYCSGRGFYSDWSLRKQTIIEDTDIKLVPSGVEQYAPSLSTTLDVHTNSGGTLSVRLIFDNVIPEIVTRCVLNTSAYHISSSKQYVIGNTMYSRYASEEVESVKAS